MDGVHIYDENLNSIHRDISVIDWSIEDLKGGFERHAQGNIWTTKALYETYHRRLNNGVFEMEDIEFSKEYLNSLTKVYIVACGTAYHAGLVGKRI